jgi:ABC-type dipeptide/oligopeptide/nickel transport system permease subunit
MRPDERAPGWLAQAWARREWRNARFLVSGGIILCFVVAAVLAPLLAPHDPLRIFPGQVLKPPSAVHWLGTDELGRSTLSRLIHGARASLQVAFMAVIIATIAGSGLGIMAAYHGGLVDMLLMRTMDLVLCLPMMILTITVVAFMGSSITNLILVIGVLYTPGTARIVYTTALSIRQTQYVQAAQAVGASALRIMARHMLPNVIAPLLVHITLSIGFVILTESGLSFLGLGPPPPTPTWGQMISVGRTVVHRQPVPLLVPMFAVSTVILALNVLGDALRDILDPRLRGSARVSRDRGV